MFVLALNGCAHTGVGLATNDCLRPLLTAAQMTAYRSSLAEDRFRSMPDRQAKARLRGSSLVPATDAEAALLDEQRLDGAYYYLVRSAYLVPANPGSRVSVPKYFVSLNRDDQSILVSSFHISEGQARTAESVLVVALPFKPRARYVDCATAF